MNPWLDYPLFRTIFIRFLVAFSPLARIWGECLTMHSLPALFFKVEISPHTLIPLIRPKSVHSGSASWDDCSWMFYDKLHVGFFPNRSPHYAWTVAWSAHSNLAGPRVHAYLGVTCHLHFWQNGQGLLCTTAATWGWNGCRIRVSKQS